MGFESARDQYRKVMADAEPGEGDEAFSRLVARGGNPDPFVRNLALIGDDRVHPYAPVDFVGFEHPVETFQQLDNWIRQMIVEIGNETALRILLFIQAHIFFSDPSAALDRDQLGAFAFMIQRGVLLRPLPAERVLPGAEYDGEEDQRQAFICCVRRSVTGLIGRQVDQGVEEGSEEHLSPGLEVALMIQGRQGCSNGRTYLDRQDSRHLERFQRIQQPQYQPAVQRFYENLRDELLGWQWGVRDQAADMARSLHKDSFDKISEPTLEWYQDWL